MARIFVLTLAVLAATPCSVHAQAPQGASERVEAAKARAAQANIPVGLIEDKIREGRAKGASADQIAAVIERRAAALVRAQAAIASSGRQLSGAELGAGADALEAGVDAGAIRAAIESAAEGRGAVAIAVLDELVTRQGVAPEHALKMVRDAMSRGSGALERLPAQAAAARERRAAPAAFGRPAGMGGSRSVGVAGAPVGVPHGPPAGVPGVGGRPSSGGKPVGTQGGRPGGGL